MKDKHGKEHSKENGQFVAQGGVGAQKATPAEEKRAGELLGETEDIASLLGEEFSGVNGQAAIEKLLKEKKGHVKGAFMREDIGGIDLLWGDSSMGLQHIIERRTEENSEFNEHEFFNGLADVIENGVFVKKNDKGRFEFAKDGKYIVVSPELRGNKVMFLLTAFARKKKSTTR